MPTTPADTTTSGLNALVTLEPADLIVVVDVSDPTMSPNGTDKKSNVPQIFGSPSNGQLIGWAAGLPAPVTLTTTGSAGPATLGGGTLNIPQYSGGSGSGTVSAGTVGQLSAYNGTTTVSPVRMIYASAYGVPAIASVATPQSGPDGTAALTAMLALNAPGGTFAGQSIEYVIDIPILANNVPIYSNSIVRGQGAFDGQKTVGQPASGVWMKAIPSSGGGDTSSNIFKNANWASPYQGGTITDHDIVIRDIYLDGQRRNGASGNVGFPWANPVGQIVSPIQFYGVDNLLIENVYIYDPCCYGIHLANVYHFGIRNFKSFDPTYFANQTLAGRNTDGIHINGPASFGTIDGVHLTCGDDGIALNAADGNLSTTTGTVGVGPLAFGSFNNVYCGTISHVHVRNIHCNGARNVGRFLKGTDSRGGGTVASITDIEIDGVDGTAGGLWVALTQGYAQGGICDRITLRNHSVIPSAGAFNNGFTPGGPWGQLTFDNWQTGDLPAGSSANSLFHQIAPTADFAGSTINIINRRIVEDTSQVATPVSPIVMVAGSTLDTLNLYGNQWIRTSSTAVPYLSVTGGTINRINVFDGVFSYINNVVAITGGTVGGVLFSGFGHRNSNGNGSLLVGSGVTLPRLRASGLDTAFLWAGPGAITSVLTDGTADATKLSGAYIAYYDSMSALTVGVLAGQTSTSGYGYANTGASTVSFTNPIYVDSLPSITNSGLAGNTSAALVGWTAPSANYGIGALGTQKSAGSYYWGVLARCALSGTNLNCYFGGAGTAIAGYAIYKFQGGTSTVINATAHTFTTPEEHYLYLEALGTGGTVTLNLYVDGTLVCTGTDSSTPLVAAGQIGLTCYGDPSTTTTITHILEAQTDAQQGTLTGPSSGAHGSPSGTMTMTLEVPATLAYTATLSDGSLGGTFSPPSLTFAGGTNTGAGAKTATFTYNAPSAGTYNLTATVSTPVATFNSNTLVYTAS